MQMSDHPDNGTASGDLTFDEGVEALEGIIDLSNDGEPVEGHVQKKAPSEPQGDDDADAAEQDLEDEESDEADTEEEDEESDESEELSDDTVIELGDGKRATLAELRESHLKLDKRLEDTQRDYTRKTQELGERRSAVEAQERRILEHAQEVARQRDQFFAIMQHILPREPEIPQNSRMDDPIAWDEYQEAKARYDQQMRRVGQLNQQMQQQVYQDQEKMHRQMAEWAKKEREQLFEARPELRDPATLQKINTDLVTTFQNVYGIRAEELQQVIDHRHTQVMLDALAYRKLKASKPDVKQKLAGKPQMLQSGKTRTTRKNSQSRRRNEAAERLRKTGSLEDGVNAILNMDIDL